MDIADISPAAMVGAVNDMRQAQTTQEVQIRVLKKAIDVQASGVATLLSGVAGSLPLASGGSLGTQLNRMV